MSGLNLGLAAADAYYRADDARVLREQQRERFGWDKQRTEADLSTLPERTEANRSGYQLQSAQNRANLDIVPNQAAVAKALSEFSVEELPSRIAQMRQQRIFSDVDAQTAGIAKLADLIQMGDPQQITSYLNAWRKTNPSGVKADVAQVGFTKDEKGENVFVALDAQGNPLMQMSAGQIQRVRDSLGKTDLKVLKPGDTLVGVKNGRATNMATGPVDPQLIKGLGKQNSPAEIQTMNWLIENKVAKDQKQAWDMVRSSREKTRSSFVLDYVSKNAMPGMDPKKVADQAGIIYDELRRGDADTGQSNSTSTSTLDPRVNSLIGLPSP